MPSYWLKSFCSERKRANMDGASCELGTTLSFAIQPTQREAPLTCAIQPIQREAPLICAIQLTQREAPLTRAIQLTQREAPRMRDTRSNMKISFWWCPSWTLVACNTHYLLIPATSREAHGWCILKHFPKMRENKSKHKLISSSQVRSMGTFVHSCWMERVSEEGQEKSWTFRCPWGSFWSALNWSEAMKQGCDFEKHIPL